MSLNVNDPKRIQETLLFHFLTSIGELDTFMCGVLMRANGDVAFLSEKEITKMFIMARGGVINAKLAWRATPMNKCPFVEAGKPDTQRGWQHVNDTWDRLSHNVYGALLKEHESHDLNRAAGQALQDAIGKFQGAFEPLPF